MECIQKNVLEGIAYYQDLFKGSSFFRSHSQVISLQLQNYKLELSAIEIPQVEK